MRTAGTSSRTEENEQHVRQREGQGQGRAVRRVRSPGSRTRYGQREADQWSLGPRRGPCPRDRARARIPPSRLAPLSSHDRHTASRPPTRKTPVTHRNAPLSLEGRRRLVQRCQHRPIVHIAAEMATPVHVPASGSTGIGSLVSSVSKTDPVHRIAGPLPRPLRQSAVSSRSVRRARPGPCRGRHEPHPSRTPGPRFGLRCRP